MSRVSGEEPSLCDERAIYRTPSPEASPRRWDLSRGAAGVRRVACGPVRPASRSVEFRIEIGLEHMFFRRCSAFGAGAQLPRRPPTACGTDAHRGARGLGCRRPAGGRPQRPRRYPPRLGLRLGPGRIDVRQNDIDRPNPRDASGEPRDCKDLSDTCGAPSLQCHSDGHPVPGSVSRAPSCSASDRAGEIAGPDDVLSMQSHGAKERQIPFVPDRDSFSGLPPFPPAIPDLEPEVNRSRHGTRPISVRNTTDLDEGAAGAGPAHSGPAPPRARPETAVV